MDGNEPEQAIKGRQEERWGGGRRDCIKQHCSALYSLVYSAAQMLWMQCGESRDKTTEWKQKEKRQRTGLLGGRGKGADAGHQK